jgi:hypothetical protein
MKRYVWLLAALSTSGMAQSASYDPMEDLVSSAKKEINAKEGIEAQKTRIQSDPRRKKIEAGYWQFFQAKADARPGDFCTAVFWRGTQMITLTGPGGAYKGALLAFVALDPPSGFPRPDDAKQVAKVKVSLTQGTDAPASVIALSRTIGGFSDEIAFVVPSIEGLLAGIREKQAFKIDYEGKQVFALEWHSGLAARDQLARCLSGSPVNGREVP